MKYIKTFEKNIKSTDTRIVPIIRYFSDKLVDITKSFDKINSVTKPSLVTRFFTDKPNPGEGVNIYYGAGTKLLEIKLEYRKSWNKEIENIILKIKIFSGLRQDIQKELKDFKEFFKEKLKNYKDSNAYMELFDQSDFIIPVNEINDVIDELNEYYMYVDAKNFNL